MPETLENTQETAPENAAPEVEAEETDTTDDELSDEELSAWEASANRRTTRPAQPAETNDDDEEPKSSAPSLADELAGIQKDIESIDGVTDPGSEYTKRALAAISKRIDALTAKPTTKKQAPAARTGEVPDAAQRLAAIVDTMPANRDGYFDDPDKQSKLLKTARRMLEDDIDEGKLSRKSINDSTEMRYIAKAAAKIRGNEDAKSRESKQHETTVRRNASRTPAGSATGRGSGGGSSAPPKVTGNFDADLKARREWSKRTGRAE